MRTLVLAALLLPTAALARQFEGMVWSGFDSGAMRTSDAPLPSAATGHGSASS